MNLNGWIFAVFVLFYLLYSCYKIGYGMGYAKGLRELNGYLQKHRWKDGGEE